MRLGSSGFDYLIVNPTSVLQRFQFIVNAYISFEEKKIVLRL